MPASLLALGAAALVTAAATGVQRTIGFGFAVLSVPILSLIDPDLAPVPQLLMTVPLTMAMAWRERGAVDLSGVGWILAGRLPGALVGVVLLRVATKRTLDFVIAVMVLGAVTVIASGIQVRRTRATQFAAGVTSGTTGLVASIGGPPLALLYRNERGATIRSSLATIFTVGIAISITARGLAGEISGSDVTAALILFPAMVVGYLAGGSMVGRIEGAPLRTAILVLSALAAAGLLLRAVLG